MRRASWFNIMAVALGLAFLYLPIVILVIYSFNASRLVTVWGGWSTRWYAALLEDRALLEAAWVTLRIALLSATVATMLGTLAAIALVRLGRFRGRVLFSGMIYAPLVMPEVITGLSLLLLFVALARRPGARELHHRTGRHHLADPHLLGGSSRREAGDQRDLHHPDRRRCGGAGRRLAADQAASGRARTRRAPCLAGVRLASFNRCARAADGRDRTGTTAAR